MSYKKYFIMGVIIICIFMIILNSNYLVNITNSNYYMNYNLHNKGIAAEDDRYIYYTTKSGLYKFNKNKGKMTKLYDKPVWYINLVEEWIYCLDLDKGSIIKLSKDGKTQNKINISDKYILDITVIDNYIYYTAIDEYKGLFACKSDLDGNKIYKLNIRNATNIIFCKNTIYFRNENKLKKINFNNKTLQVIPNLVVKEFIIVKDTVYYVSDDKRLYKANIDGTNIVKLSDDYVDSLNYSEHWIYYSNFSDKSVVKGTSGKLYKINVNTFEKIKIDDYNATCINIIDNKIYFKGNEGFGTYRIKTDGSEFRVLK